MKHVFALSLMKGYLQVSYCTACEEPIAADVQLSHASSLLLGQQEKHQEYAVMKPQMQD